MLFASFTAIYMLIDFFEKIDNFLEKGKSMALVFKFFLLNIPFIIDQMGPVCILLAGVITLGILNHSNELIALKACGVPLRKITTPILLTGVLFSMLLLSMSQFVLPKTMTETNRIWHREVRGRVAMGIYRNGLYYYRGENGFYSFSRARKVNAPFRSFSFTSWDDDYHLITKINANRAVYKEGKWILYRGQIQTATKNNDFTTELFRKREFSFPENPDTFFIPQYQTMELSLLELYREIKRQRSPDDIKRGWSIFWGRISYTLLGIPLLLLGLPLLLIVYRRWGRDLSLAVPASCGMAFACWGTWGALQSLAKTGYLPPLFAAMCVHLIMGAIGFLLLRREDV